MVLRLLNRKCNECFARSRRSLGAFNGANYRHVIAEMRLGYDGAFFFYTTMTRGDGRPDADCSINLRNTNENKRANGSLSLTSNKKKIKSC